MCAAMDCVVGVCAAMCCSVCVCVCGILFWFVCVCCVCVLVEFLSVRKCVQAWILNYIAYGNQRKKENVVKTRIE